MFSYLELTLPQENVLLPRVNSSSGKTLPLPQENVLLPRVNSSSGKCSLKFIGPKVWSSIPNDIKFSTTFTFKWKLKKHLLHEKNSQL